MSDWRIFTGKTPHPTVKIPNAPPWRRSRGATAPVKPPQLAQDDSYWARAQTFKTPDTVIDPVNAALRLRRPLLVTGNPGTGKSTLIYRVAFELGLGPVLVWAINSRTTLAEGQYNYDAVGRLQAKNIASSSEPPDIGEYIQLGPLGTALMPWTRPRALLVDEIDKADVDLPNDLLNIFEEGSFTIPELARHGVATVKVRTAEVREPEAEGKHLATIVGGQVRCFEFPLVVLTSNREREFPPAFLRRCLRIEMPNPGETELTEIVKSHLGERKAQEAAELIGKFSPQIKAGKIAPDQLLNAVHLLLSDSVSATSSMALRDVLLKELETGS